MLTQGASETLTSLQDEVNKTLSLNEKVVLASNTCSASLASLPVVAKHYPEIKLLWIDAHGDFNTPETTGTGYLGGMVLGAVCGQWDSGYGSGINPNQVILVGAHDIDQGERGLLEKAGVKIIPPKEVNYDSVKSLISESKIWIHIDWDVLEPGQIPADYKVNGGLRLPQLINLFKSIPSNQVLGLELAEFSADDFESESNKKGMNNIRSTVKALFNNI
ncbi:arginase family protein [Endozoicomonas acroporae]|uniref:arginase family protein n=1 Tax=Endozoicomonas acroporae TaxID=1701104 RepID=UPI003D7AD9E5